MSDVLHNEVATTSSFRSKLTQIVREDTVGLHPRLQLANMFVRLLPPATASHARAAVLRSIGFEIGQGTLFRGRPRMNGGKDLYDHLKIGQFCLIDVNCSFDLEERITIGDRVTIGHQAMILTSSHEIGTKEQRAGALYRAPVVIEAGAWLGPRCMILPGVTIGAGAIVAAGALVNKDVPANTRVAGTPAKVIEQLDSPPA